ncbi:MULTISPECIES: dephospho-CoA kinase [unclassified Methanosarcina]|uniref:dephospho-CoA kinase n=1 Tax=unclassified Methanosarcina TaxID=2644672 RepID=UPI000616074E|nr:MULTISPECIES: dephospho-CoA kinase [unclassified Methanosarcina]AKB16865.1 Dephospho-CoA kinase archaeal, predicted [Methanosarcina sp. WWM596]AKB20273.1 Dephospho-CoA kinase archaeal, predicted [Methanosarcina sp. WH1]
MKIIAFVGMPASGKSEASRIAAEMGIPVIIMGDVIRKEVLRRGLEPNDSNTGMVATDLRKCEGMDAVSRRCISQIRETGSELVVVDGVRGIAEVECFRQEFGKGFILISIYAPIEIRFSRVQKRGRSDDMNSIEGLRHRDERELGWGMGEAIEASNVEIENNSTLEAFRKDVIDVLGNYSGSCPEKDHARKKTMPEKI